MNIGHAASFLTILKALSIGIIVFGVVILGWKRKHRIEQELEDAELDELDDCFEESEEELRRAERAAAMTADERRAALGPEYQLCAQMSTYQGFRDRDLAVFLSGLEEKGIRAQVILEDALTPKAARSMQVMGVFELYVHEEDIDRAEPMIDAFIQMKMGAKAPINHEPELAEAPVL